MPAGFRSRGFDAQHLNPLLDQLFALAEEVGDAGRATKTTFGGLAALALPRVTQSVRGAFMLAENGLIGDAMTLARTPVEIAIDIAYIALDADTRVSMFMDHDHVRKYEFALAVDELHDGATDQEALDKLRRRAEDASARHPTVADRWANNGGWAGVGVKRRATDGDRLQLYKLLYRDMCDASHSGYGTLEYAMVDLDGDPKISYRNMKPDEGPAVLAAGALLTLIGTVVDSLHLDANYGERSTAIVRAMTRQPVDAAPKPGGVE